MVECQNDAAAQMPYVRYVRMDLVWLARLLNETPRETRRVGSGDRFLSGFGWMDIKWRMRKAFQYLAQVVICHTAPMGCETPNILLCTDAQHFLGLAFQI